MLDFVLGVELGVLLGVELVGFVLGVELVGFALGAELVLGVKLESLLIEK